MKDLGIERLFSGPPEGIVRTTGFIFEGKEILCPSDELLPKLRELMQIRVLEIKAAKGNDFGWALAQLKEHSKVARKGWNGKGMWINMQIPDKHSKMSLPYIYMFTADEKQVPWLCSQTDMLSDDWEIV